MDPEKGLISATTRSGIPSWASSAPDNAAAVASSTAQHTPLQLFQLLVGIDTPADLTQDGFNTVSNTTGGKKRSKRTRTDNVGLYERAKQQERASRLAYISTSFISNTLYMLQILLAATFTALSAYKDSNRVTLTVLGAMNTVLAGSLAWQKGQGVPQRYRKAMDEYQALLLEIEMAERSFCDIHNLDDETRLKLDPRAEEARLKKMWDTARANQQANYPDLYVSTAAGGTATKESKDLAKEVEAAKAETAKVQSDLMAKIEDLVAKLAVKAEAHAESAVDNIGRA